MATFSAQIVIDADSNMNQVINNINKHLKKLQKEGKKTSLVMAGLSKKMSKTGKAMQAAGAKMAIGMTLPIAAATVGMIKAASNAEEVGAKFNTVFEDVQKDANATAQNIAKNFGLAESSAKELLSSSGDLLTGFGFTDEAALDMSKRIAELSVDVASFSNVQGGAARVAAALNSSLTGEREALKSLGIVINEDLIKRELQAKGLQNLTGENLRAAKANITLDLAYRQSAKAIGDFQRTQEGAANQFRIVQERTKNLAEQFGAVLLPIVVKITTKLVPLIDKFSELSMRNKKLILIAAAVAAALGPIIFIAGTLMTSIAALIPAVTALGGAFMFLFASPPGLVILAIVAAVAALTVIVKKNWRVIKPFLIDVWGRIKRVAIPALKEVLAQVRVISSELRESLAPIIQLISRIFKEVFGSSASDELMSFAQIISDVVIVALKAMLSLLQYVVGSIGQMVGEFKQIVKWVDKLNLGIGDKISNIGAAMKSDFGKIKNFFSGEAGKIEGQLNGNVAQSTPAAASPVNVNSKSKLDINMTVDSEGRPSIKKVDSDENTDFKASLGRMSPIGA